MIFNTLSITVAQRTREFATLRTLGGSRKQVMRSVVLEGFVIGLLASALGLIAGIGLAKGMLALFAAMGIELPDAATVIAPRTIIVSIVVGTLVTLRGQHPARPPGDPRAADRGGPRGRDAAALAPRRVPRSRPASASSLAAVAALATGMFAGGLSTIGTASLLGGGVLGLFVGMALLAPRLVGPLARFVGLPARRAGGVAGELAGANAVRNPGRTASTAAALMIGITLVTLVAVLGVEHHQDDGRPRVTEELHAGYVIDAQRRHAVPRRRRRPAGARGGRQARLARPLRHGRSSTARSASITGIDPATIAHFYRFTWSKGSEHALGKLGDDGAIVTKDYAKSHHLAIGGTLPITTPSGDKRTLVVRGLHVPKSQLLGEISMTQQAFDTGVHARRRTASRSSTPTAARTGAQSPGRRHRRRHVPHRRRLRRRTRPRPWPSMLAMLYVLLGFSVVVSLFGMVNTLVLSVFERTREIGMLRTIGMTRRQTRRMIRHESIITALIGAALGLGLGTALAALVLVKWHLRDRRSRARRWCAFTLVAVLAGIAAAVMPARRASRLDVLKALQYE